MPPAGYCGILHAMRIPIVEDDGRTSDFVSGAFRQVGYATVCCRDGEEGAAALRDGSYDAAVVDIMLPKRDGLSILSAARAAGRNLPIIVLSALGNVDAKIRGLEAGADDYLAKPFSVAELLARVQALLRRATQTGPALELRVEDLVMDLVSHKVTRAGRPVELQPLEYQLLEYLMRNKGRVVSKSTILERVWDYDFDPHTNVVESRVSRLRDKIDRQAERKLIRTVRGVGYVLG